MRPQSPYPRLGMSAWRDRAACGSADPRIFEAKSGAAAERAKAWCRVCPVVAECLESALVCDDTDGIRGGLTPSERRHLHKAAAERLDPGRVQAVFDGHDIHLSKRETAALENAALERGLSISALTWLLKISTDQAEKLHARPHRSVDESVSAADRITADLDALPEDSENGASPGDPIDALSNSVRPLRRSHAAYDDNTDEAAA